MKFIKNICLISLVLMSGLTTGNLFANGFSIGDDTGYGNSSMRSAACGEAQRDLEQSFEKQCREKNAFLDSIEWDDDFDYCECEWDDMFRDWQCSALGEGFCSY